MAIVHHALYMEHWRRVDAKSIIVNQNLITDTAIFSRNVTTAEEAAGIEWEAHPLNQGAGDLDRDERLAMLPPWFEETRQQQRNLKYVATTDPFVVEFTETELTRNISNGEIPQTLKTKISHVRRDRGLPEPMVADPAFEFSQDEGNEDQLFPTFQQSLLAGDEEWLSEHTPEKARIPRVRPQMAAIAEEGPVSDEKLTFTRPNGELYYGRLIHGIIDVTFARQMRQDEAFMLLTGDPGTGKTAWMEATFGDELHTIEGSADTERADFWGGWVERYDPKTGKRAHNWVDGPGLIAATKGEVLFIDDALVIDPRTLTELYTLMDGRGTIRINDNPDIGEVKAEPGFFVVAAGNPNVAGARLSEALSSRFLVQVEHTTDYVMAEKKLGVDPLFITVCNSLTDKQKHGRVKWVPQMRECLAFQKLSVKYSPKLALSNVLAVCPERDRKEVMKVIEDIFGYPVKPLGVDD